MNMILLRDFNMTSEKTAELKDRQFYHVKKYLKPELGKKLRVGYLNGKMGFGTVSEISQSCIKMELELNELPHKRTDLDLILSLPRPPVFKRVLENLAAVGIKNIYIINSSKVEKSYWSSRVLKERKYKRYLYLGLEQGCETILPEIHFKRSFKKFSDEMPELFRFSDKKFVAHPYSPSSCPADIPGHKIVALGPEGGFSDFEIDKFKNNGFKPLMLGKRILKVEFAVYFLIGRLF